VSAVIRAAAWDDRKEERRMGQTHSVAMAGVPAQRRRGRTPTPAQPWSGAETIALTAAGRTSLEQELRRLRAEPADELAERSRRGRARAGRDLRGFSSGPALVTVHQPPNSE